jgi:hypothetical protein
MFNPDINLTFYPSKPEYLDYVEKPYPAIKNMPSWLENTPSYYTGEKSVDENNDPTSTIKKCLPVIDCMSAGYHIPLPCDVWVERITDRNGREGINLKWSLTHIKIAEMHKMEQLINYPLDTQYEDIVFKWINLWTLRTPKGWSCIFIQPQYHEELPFKCMSALVDTDKFPIPVNFPFLIKKGFVGLIPKGTPMIQVIPFKRQKFVATFKRDHSKLLNEWFKAASVFFDIYKKHFRTKKEYIVSESKCPFARLLK